MKKRKQSVNHALNDIKNINDSIKRIDLKKGYPIEHVFPRFLDKYLVS